MAAGLIAIVVGRVILLDLLGKDTTLTSKTVEWANIMPFAMQHLWRRYGAGAFWTVYRDSLQVMRSAKRSMHNADSGYIDLFLRFGIVGLVRKRGALAVLTVC